VGRPTGTAGQASRQEDLVTKVAELESQLAHLLKGGAGPEPRGAAPASVTNNTQNNITVFAPVTTTNVLAIGANTIAAGGPPGWPQGWAPPPTPPLPFAASLTIPLDVLKRALPTGEHEKAACQRGEPGAVAALMVEIVRHLHADPQRRNMYLNPKRADQVLVYIPERWEVRPLLEAVDHVFSDLADGIGSSLQKVAPPMRVLAVAARDGFQLKRTEVVRRSRSAMAAHLENMGTIARNGEGGSWLGDVGEGTPGGSLVVFGHERGGHLTCDALVDNLERSLGVFDTQGLESADMPVVARRALLTYARLLLTGRPENLTVASHEPGGAACVHTPWGWRQEAAGAAARQQAAAMLQSIADYLEVAKAPHFAPLGAHITSHLEDLAHEEGEAQEILARYAGAAERHHGLAWVRGVRERCASEAGGARGALPPPPPPSPSADLDALLDSLLV
jgi:hypothetical protein